MSNSKVAKLEFGVCIPNLGGERRWRKGTFGKQMTFWNDKWALRRRDGRYNSLVTMFGCGLLPEKIKVASKEGIYYTEFFLSS